MSTFKAMMILARRARGARDAFHGIPARSSNPFYMKGYAREYERQARASAMTFEGF
jgi:hypothetical protein